MNSDVKYLCDADSVFHAHDETVRLLVGENPDLESAKSRYIAWIEKIRLEKPRLKKGARCIDSNLGDTIFIRTPRKTLLNRLRTFNRLYRKAGIHYPPIGSSSRRWLSISKV